VRSPPLREMAKRWGQGLPGANRGTAPRAVFSEGRALRVRIERSCACRDIAFPPGAWRIGPWPKRGNIWVWRDAFLPGVRSPPLRGVDHPRGDGLAGRPRDNPKGGFVGGMRPARPRGKAGHEPRHNMIIGGKGTPGALAGPRFGQARALPAGVRSPPLREMAKRWGQGLPGANRGTAPRAVFSEGCALRVRVVRLDTSRGIT